MIIGCIFDITAINPTAKKGRRKSEKTTKLETTTFHTKKTRLRKLTPRPSSTYNYSTVWDESEPAAAPIVFRDGIQAPPTTEATASQTIEDT